MLTLPPLRVSLDLPHTGKGYRPRAIVTATPDGPGLVEAVLAMSRRDCETYSVAEDCSEAFPFRAFLWMRLTGPIEENRDGAYRVVVTGHGHAVCSCTGSVTRHGGRCKHGNATVAMLAEGLLDAA